MSFFDEVRNASNDAHESNLSISRGSVPLGDMVSVQVGEPWPGRVGVIGVRG